MDLSLWGNDDPFQEMRKLQRAMFGLPDERRVASGNAWDWQPHCDISETDKEIKLHAELPGVKKEDVKVDVKDGMLVVSGETKHESEEKSGENEDRHWHRIERRSGKFIRRMQLPENADVEKIKANAENGVLTVTVPKTSPPKPRSHQVAVNFK